MITMMMMMTVGAQIMTQSVARFLRYSEFLVVHVFADYRAVRPVPARGDESANV